MNYESKYNELVEAARAVVEGNPGLCKTDEGLGRLSKLLPERESEDERIRRLLVWQVHRNIEDETNDLAQSVYDGIKGHDPELEESIKDWKKCLAYLEKQKDAIGAARQQGYEEGLEDGIKMNMAEQMGESKEWADELSAEIDRISKRYPEVSFAKLSRVAVHFVRWQKEQKPFSQEVFDIAKHEALWGEQPPAEWSEEDEQWLESIIKDYEDSLFKDKDHVAVIKVKIDFLKSLRPQPHWKPSEEQMAALNEAINEAADSGSIHLNSWRYNLLKEIKEKIK